MTMNAPHTMFVLERTVPPEEEPVTLEELKRHLRTFASDTSEDDDLNALITNGREWAEDYTGRALLAQTWRLTLDSFYGRRRAWLDQSNSVVGVHAGYYSGAYAWLSGGELLLRRAPVVSVDEFVFVSADGSEVDVPASQWELCEADSKWPRVVPLNGASWGVGTFRLTFKAGFTDVELVPKRFKQAIKLHAEAHYDRDPEFMALVLGADGRPGIIHDLLKSERSDLQMA